MAKNVTRNYDSQRDRDHVARIYHEANWIERSEFDKISELDAWWKAGDTLVTELDGAAEVLAQSVKGTMRYLTEDLPLSHVSDVLTSRIARQRGLASRTTALLMQKTAGAGAAVARLSAFDQGYYDRLGFGALSYQREMTIDPAQLRVPTLTRTPRRLTVDDAEEVHQNRLDRIKTHAACNLENSINTQKDFIWREDFFGLGFNGDDGKLTHHLTLKPGKEHGPYTVTWMAYEKPAQLIELLSLLRSLADQLYGVRLEEPAFVQLQDLLKQPFRVFRTRRHSEFDVKPYSLSWEQFRILDLQACIDAVHLPGDSVRFNLDLDDPIETYLADDEGWRGIGGQWCVTLGPSSSIKSQHEKGLPLLRASAAAFSRLWLGVQPARSLSVGDNLEGDPDLLMALEGVLRLPRPITDWGG